MLQVLVESRASREPRTSWAAVSIVLHSAAIGVALYLTARVAPSAPTKEPVETLVYSAPAPAPAPVPLSGGIAEPFTFSHPVVRMPTVPIPSFDLPVGDVFTRVLEELSGTERSSATGTPGTSVPTGGIYTAATVDRIVMPLAGNASPIYPTRLSGAGVEGEVLARFVVDTTGRVESKSIEILQTSHGLFGEAVTRWLRENRYAPALVNGRPVRQLVQQSIGFTLRR